MSHAYGSNNRSYGRSRHAEGPPLANNWLALAITFLAFVVALSAPTPLAMAGCEEGCEPCEACENDECVPLKEGQCCQKSIQCTEGCEDPEECCGEVSVVVDECEGGYCPGPDECCDGSGGGGGGGNGGGGGGNGGGGGGSPPEPPDNGGGCRGGATGGETTCVDNGDGSRSCSTSYDPCDNGGGGSGDIQVHSLRASFDLGLRADGQDAGALAIRTREPRESLCTPDELFYTDSTPPADVEIWRDANGALRQVKTPQ